MKLRTALLLICACSPAWATTALRYDWPASTDVGGTGVFGYNVYRCTGAACTPSVMIGSTTTNAYFDSTTAASTTYCYSAQAFDEFGQTSGLNTPSCKTSLAAATVNAASISLANVQTAVAAANDGDIVVVPNGTATWAGTVTFDPAIGVTVKCQTVGGCNISVGGTAFQTSFTVSGDNYHFYRISGFNFTETSVGGSPIFIDTSFGLGMPLRLWNIRIDHNTFIPGDASTAQINCANGSDVGVYCFGVIDHNTLTGSAVGGGNLFNWTGLTDPTPLPSSYGNANNMFIEDNTCTSTNMGSVGNSCVDVWGGARMVLRHNTYNDYLELTHGAAHGGGYENFEFYNNTVVLDSGTNVAFQGCFRCFFSQGSGENIVFSNRFTPFSGHDPDAINMIYFRDDTADANAHGLNTCDGTKTVGPETASQASITASITGGTSLNVTAFSAADTALDVGSVIAGTGVTLGTSVTACPGSCPSQATGIYTITSSTNVASESMTAKAGNWGDSSFDGNRSPTGTYIGYPCWHQPGRDFTSAAMTLKPMYAWDNKFTDNNAIIPFAFQSGSTPDHVAANRDYFDAVSVNAQTSSTSPFNGTTGTGFGTLARRPATCSTAGTDAADAGNGGVGYFATDKGPGGTLYRCASTNHWVVHYQPYSQTDGVTPSGRHPITQYGP